MTKIYQILTKEEQAVLRAVARRSVGNIESPKQVLRACYDRRTTPVSGATGKDYNDLVLKAEKSKAKGLESARQLYGISENIYSEPKKRKR